VACVGAAATAVQRVACVGLVSTRHGFGWCTFSGSSLFLLLPRLLPLVFDEA